MGSIQGLRSEALAERAREDTNVQISGYLGGVNKGLGTQLSNLIDSLQGVIADRTKIYSSIMEQKVKKTIEGKQGVGEIVIQKSFALVRTIITGISLALGDAAVGALEVTKLVTELISSGVALIGAGHNYQAAAFDYERAAAQLGVSDDPGLMASMASVPGGVGLTNRESGGAVQLLDLRDAIMPRYKPIDPIGSSNTLGSVASNSTRRGYVGTLRRI